MGNCLAVASKKQADSRTQTDAGHRGRKRRRPGGEDKGPQIYSGYLKKAKESRIFVFRTVTLVPFGTGAFK